MRAAISPGIYLPLAALAAVLSFVSVFRVPREFPSDLYSPWYGTKQLLLHRRNPYSAEVNREIEMVFYGHVLSPSEHRDQQRFAYPLYVVLILWPLSFFSFPVANAIGFAALLMACVGAAWASIRFADWPVHWKARIFVVLAGFTTGPILRVMRYEQLAALAAFLLIAGFLAARQGRYGVAGILLALSTIKPQFALLPVAWAFLWGLSDWKNRKRLIQAFFAAFLVLMVTAEALLPGWVVDFCRQAAAYRHYAGDNSFLTMLAGKWTGDLCGAVVAAAAAWFAWTQRNAGNATHGFEFATAAVLALPAFVMPTMAAQHNQIMLFPLVVIVFREFRSLGRVLPILASLFLATSPVVRLLSLIRPGLTGETPLIAAGVLFPLVAAVMMLKVCRRYGRTATGEA